MSSRVQQFKKQLQKEQKSSRVADFKNQPAPVEPEKEEKKSVGGFLKNVVKSGGKLVKDTASFVGNAVVHPKKTLEDIADPLVGAVGKVIPGAATATQTAKANAVGGFYKERYGGVDKIKESLYNDPVGVFSDISALAGLASGAAKLGGLNRTAKVASTVSNVTNPLNVTKLVPGRNVVSNRLKTSAEKSYTQALSPTTKTNKLKTEKVVPGLLEKRTVAFTHEGLQTKAAGHAQKYGQRIEDAFDAIPEGTIRTNVKPIFDDLQKRKLKTTVKGVTVDEPAYKAFEDMQRKVLKIAEVDVSPQSMREFRQILDKGTARNGNFAFTDADSVLAEARKATANAIRNQLAEELPDIGKINKEFNFWKNVEDVITDTIKRKKPQTGALEKVAQIGGMATGSTVMQSVLKGIALKNFIKLTRSTGWKTVSAVTKNELANLLVKGDSLRASLKIKQLLNMIGAANRNQRQPASTTRNTE
jgi:hypothetical protein